MGKPRLNVGQFVAVSGAIAALLTAAAGALNAVTAALSALHNMQA